MIFIGNTSCADLVKTGEVPQADNDVSGLGVVVAFVISAYITLGIVIGAYFFGYVDHNLLRPVDIYVHKRSAHKAHHENEVYVALRQCALALSDQQIVTGVAVLIAGFVGFVREMSVYHFQIVIYLAWMSSSVHLSALTMLSGFLRERHALLGWRITGMLVLFVLLLVSLFPTSSNMWAIDGAPDLVNSTSTGWAVPAKCFLFQSYAGSDDADSSDGPSWSPGINADGPLGLVLIILSYSWKVGGLFSSARRLFRTWIRGPPEYKLECLVQSRIRAFRKKPTFVNRMRYNMSLMTYIFVFANFEFFSSFAASLWLSLLGLVWGTIQIIVPRRQNAWWAYQEDTWTFGQITPLVLLIQPLGAVLEHLGEGAKRLRESAAARRQSEGDVEMVVVVVNDKKRRKNWAQTLRAARHYRTPSALSAKLCHQEVSDVFLELEPKPPADRPIGDLLGHQRILYNSWFFASLILAIQLCIASVAFLIMLQDAALIGAVESANWIIISFALCGWLGFATFWCMLFMPFSRVFK